MLRRAQETTGLVRKSHLPQRNWSWWLAAFILGSVTLSMGCNPFTLAYFIFVTDPTLPPEYSLTEKKSDPVVVILASHASSRTMTTELFNADRLLENQLTQVLKKRYKDHGDRVKLVPPIKVQEFKAAKPNWKVMSLTEIGKEFNADYVISLEINRLTLFKAGSQGTLYHGNAEIHVAVADVQNPDEGIVWSEDYICKYPTQGPRPADHSVGAFRSRFINKMARDLSRYFAAYPTEAMHDFD